MQNKIMTVRELTLFLLDDYENNGKYVNLSLNSHMTDGMSQADRGFLTSLFYTSVERKLTYDYFVCAISKRSIDKIDTHTLNILRIGMCQILNMNSIPDFAAVNETVKLSRNRGERGFVNGILRETCRLKEKGELPLPDRKKHRVRYISVKHSFPLWLTKHFISILGEDDTEKLFSVYNGEIPTDITVNTEKISVSDMLKLLKKQNISATLSESSNFSLRLKGSHNPKQIDGFYDGYFFVQDEICAVSAQVLGTKAGDRVIDVCSCPGGKTFSAAILASETGEVYAMDLHESKLSLVADGAERLGLHNIKVFERDATNPKTELFGTFDRVICDVPCSGLGVLGKKPDMRYRNKDSLLELPKLQLEILSKSANYLKPGGTLIYSTCTLNPSENEEVVYKFKEANDNFVLTDFKAGKIESHNGMFTSYPHIDCCDGFFMAKFTKIG